MLAKEDFSWDGVSWVAEHEVPEWQSSQRIPLVVFPETSSPTSLNDGGMDIVEAYERSRPSQARAALSALLATYPEIYASFIDAIDPEFVDQDLPKISSENELLEAVTLRYVHLQPVVVDGIPYVGYEAECTWDPEHGVGILMHGDRSVQIGGADTAILQWIAEEDSRKFAKPQT